MEYSAYPHNIIRITESLPASCPRVLNEEEWEFFEERAAIMEYEGGLRREEAEHQALSQLMQRRMRLSA